jgi:hypothetical protein
LTQGCAESLSWLMLPESLDLPTALKLLGLDEVPLDYEELARQVAWHQPAAKAWSESQSLAYRTVWEAVERRIEHTDDGVSG